MPDLDDLRRMVVAKHTLQIGHRGHRVTYHLIPPGERVGDVQSVLSSPHEGPIEQLLSELDRLRSRVEELEAKLAEAREVVRPFAGKSAYFAATSEDIRRAAEWLRGQEE